MEEPESLETPAMADPDQPQVDQKPVSDAAQTASLDALPSAARKSIGGFTFSIWPPTQRIRDAVALRLVETLSSPSVLSKRYGVIPADEASEVARLVEEEAHAAAGASSFADEDGIETLQIYSREISRRMLESVKSRSSPAADPLPAKQEDPAAVDPAPVNKEVKEEVEAA